MGKKKLLTIGATLTFALVAAFSALSLNASTTSISQLSAKADFYCQNCGACQMDCKSPSTGNIYPYCEGVTY